MGLVLQLGDGLDSGYHDRPGAGDYVDSGSVQRSVSYPAIGDGAVLGFMFLRLLRVQVPSRSGEPGAQDDGAKETLPGLPPRERSFAWIRQLPDRLADLAHIRLVCS